MPRQPKAGTRPEIPRVIALIVAAIGVAITIAVVVGVKASVERRIVARFNEVATARAERLQYEIERYHDDLFTVAGHLDTADSIDREAFERLARRGTALPNLRTLMWFDASVIDASGRAPSAPERRGASPGLDANPRYIAHFAGAAAPAERNVDAAEREIFARAHQRGKPQLTAPIHTANFPYEPALYQVIIPVPLSRGPAAEPQPLRGFLVAVYRAQTVVDNVMRSASNALAVRVTDRAVPLGRNLLAVHERPADTPLLGKTMRTSRLDIGGRTWELEFTPTDAFIAANRTDEPMLVFLLGCALTAAAAIAALLWASWRRDMLTLVARRTAELAASEARQRAVVANMADALVVTDTRGMIESVNGAAQRLFGWEASELIGREAALLVPQVRAMQAASEAGDAGSHPEQPAASVGELHGLRRDGSAFPLDMALSEVPEQDGIRRIALIRDLSRERRAERAMSAFIAGTSKATGMALLHAATCSLAQALGVRYALIAEVCEQPRTLRIVSLWSGSGHATERCYDIEGEPCVEVLGRQLCCHVSGLREKFPGSRLAAEFQAQSYIGHPLQSADGRSLGIVALYGLGQLDQPVLATSLLSMAASRISAEIERLESDKALLGSRERLELAVEGSQLALWDLNVATGEVFLSERWCSMMGEPAAATHTSLAQLFGRVHPEDRAAVNHAYRAALTGSAPFYGVTHRVHRADGTLVWVRSHGKVSQRDANGRSLRLVGTNADVTWEKTAEEEVARRERELRTISDNVPATIVRLDRNFRFLYANRRYAVMAGTDVDALPGKRLIDVLGEAQYRAIEPHFRRTLEGEMVTYDREIDIVGAQRRWMEVTLIPDVNAEWEVQGVFCIGLDVTERKEIERRMVEARVNAEAAARTKSEFLATMSHEIRTPMNGVLGLAGLLLDTELSAEQHSYVQTLHGSATSLLDILNDILDMSKIEAGKLALEPIAFELAATVEDVAALWAPRAAAKSLELAVQIDASCPRCVIGDPGRIRQVLGNLLGNAIKFTGSGHVLLRASAAGESAEDAQVLFEVEDTGVGIAAADCRRLFEPFSQADTSTTRRFGGTGLGLAICRRLVQLMSGEIGVESTPGKGSRFWFSASLPAGAEQPPLEQSDLDGKRVLVVDDHPVNRMVLRKQMQAFGMRVTVAADAAQAWERLHAAGAVEAFDAVVLDHHMPGTDGIELGRRMLADPRWRTLPIVLLTSGGHKYDSARARAVGFAGYLIKPARSSLLRKVLEAAVAGRPFGEILLRQRVEAPAERFSGRILLVEDNEVNRRVAVAVLRKLGLEVDAVVDGEEAIECVNAIEYDLILTDMHMPRMDGLEAARVIRAREAGGARRVPIVAMTANVVAEARSACFDAGMDDFLPKPFLRAQLVNALSRWLPVASGKESEHAALSLAAAVPVTAAVPVMLPVRRDAGEMALDRARLDALRDAIGDDFVELITVFLESAAEVLETLRDACRRGDGDGVYRQAHTLKSSAANVGATALSAVARHLESEAKAGSLSAAAAGIDEIERELERVKPLLLRLANRAREGAWEDAHAVG
ncbi:MAG: response regulator [Betaproteobacteria bacterium]|nr:response regulator [Betaproteobacteria bacterium]